MFQSFVIEEKGTERPHTGEYNEHFSPGHDVCTRYATPLYTTEHKFESHCGWPPL
ncbi:peptide-methionine (R)-S-oxide reductase [Lelliottia sp.]|uniref:peptide-methionine (R)-S-oxide reductase n=1 Tax=Lelliottia sp. TaxID=1898429 RepID=UPI0038902A53